MHLRKSNNSEITLFYWLENTHVQKRQNAMCIENVAQKNRSCVWACTRFFYYPYDFVSIFHTFQLDFFGFLPIDRKIERQASHMKFVKCPKQFSTLCPLNRTFYSFNGVKDEKRINKNMGWTKTIEFVAMNGYKSILLNRQIKDKNEIINRKERSVLKLIEL